MKDFFNRSLRDLRISLTDRCNFRCNYCMPVHREHHFLPEGSHLNAEEIETLARAFLALGVEKIRLTGGEPLLREDLVEIVTRLRALSPGVDLALTTNGFSLKERALELKKAGLNRLTVSVDALDPTMFDLMSGTRGQSNRVLEGIASAEAAGFSPIKINAVIKRGVNENQIIPLAKTFRKPGTILRFIEYMDVGNQNNWKAEDVFPAKDILAILREHFPLQPLRETYLGEVAKRYRYSDGSGEIGFITSISEPFCRDCNRARLSADGKFYTCLFSGKGHDLLTGLRAGDKGNVLGGRIESIWSGRKDRYSEEREEKSKFSKPEKVEMYQIGG